MASTNKTPHLGLCQWEATDPFLREDMNGDFARIDEAFGNLPRVKLFDVTVNQAVPSIQLDFTGIDISPYAELELFFKVSNNSKYMRINEETGQKYSYMHPNGGDMINNIPFPVGPIRIIFGHGAHVIKSDVDYRIYTLDKSIFGAFSSIELFGGVYFLAGDRVTVWGVRR